MPEALPADDKDWTWVLERPCPDCGYDASRYSTGDIPTVLEAVAGAFVDQLGRADADVRLRSDRWSVLEYGCHVRDCFALFDERLRRMIDEDGPTFANWDQDATALAERYDLQDPISVAGQLRDAADALAERFASVPEGAWDRRGVRSDGSHFTVATLGLYLLHDPLHHLWDVATL